MRHPEVFLIFVRRHRRFTLDLLYQAQYVPVLPPLHHLAARDTYHTDSRCAEILVSRSSKARARVPHRDRPPNTDLIRLRDRVVDRYINGRERCLHPFEEWIKSFGADRFPMALLDYRARGKQLGYRLPPASV